MALPADLAESIAKANAAAKRFTEVMRAAYPEMARHEDATTVVHSKPAVDALRDFLVQRDWPSATPRERSVRHNFTYGCMAAAILNGEAWAIRKAWPEAAYAIATSSRQ